MRMPCKSLWLCLPFALLTACGGGPEEAAPSKFVKPAEECAADVIANQYIVHYTNGSMAVVHAASERQFMSQFLKPRQNEIVYAEPDFRVHAAVWKGLANQPPNSSSADNWGAQRVEADALWADGVRGQSVSVAVVDSGMDMHHPQLAPQLFKNSGETGLDSTGRDRATNGVDDDGNGFVDDVSGYDFTNGGSKSLKGDYTYHGTHVAGIILAKHDDQQAKAAPYVQGLAPAAQILPLAFLDANGSGNISDGVRAIKYAVLRGVKVINASWGGPICSRSLRDTIQQLETQGVVFVSAAGNESLDIDTYKEYPASLNLAAQLTVGATGAFDYMAEFSNYGSQSVHLFAPGADIVSTIPGGSLAALSGTSMAAPFMSGAVALLLSAEPGAHVSQVRQALYNASVRRPDYINAAQGRLNLRRALAELRSLLQH